MAIFRSFAVHGLLSAMPERDIDVGGLSVRPSVRPLHAGIDATLMIIRSRGFYQRVSQELVCFVTTLVR